MKINILTLFPEMFYPVLNASMLGKACEKGLLQFNIVDIREYSRDKHHKADDYPFGGGAGMLMMAQPICDCMENNAFGGKKIYMSPRGKVLDADMVKALADEEELTILCGHYEGVDQRVLDKYDYEELSIGDYILTGGELPSMVLIDSVARLIDGVLASEESALEESIYTGLLEADQYTQPREYEGDEVPEVLTSGNHGAIELWRYENSLRRTKKTRPDLFWAYAKKVEEADEKIAKAKREKLPKPEGKYCLDKQHHVVFLLVKDSEI
ncbi:MAG: tRNA (guanosine(37)-N1)-methyltransferase TrmD [Clostridia bacterium]|nr:tRNA (guanosine(37)-N1)-methyltransferase TrmD [Clostridia bacterium]